MSFERNFATQDCWLVSMPPKNNFRHQVYSPDLPKTEFTILRPTTPPNDESIVRQRLGEVGRKLESAGVSSIYLLHGTFAGTDSLGVIREISRVSPRFSNMLGKNRKSLVDKLTGDAGNFTADYAAQLSTSINVSTNTSIQVKRFDWSSENHHLGRADGAICLLKELVENARRGQRTLLVGHSHAGNVFALLTNLLCADKEIRKQFFHAARWFYQIPLIKRIDAPIWDEVKILLNDVSPLDFCLDIVTMGTPVRYGWDSDGYRKLLHFIHHRPVENEPLDRIRFPPTIDELVGASSGDFIQHMGIAGTNFMPYLLTLRNWFAERRLAKLLQSTTKKRDLIQRLGYGQRLHDEGSTLLVEYPDVEQAPYRSALGHAVYTRCQWMLFHFEEIAQRFYGN